MPKGKKVSLVLKEQEYKYRQFITVTFSRYTNVDKYMEKFKRLLEEKTKEYYYESYWCKNNLDHKHFQERKENYHPTTEQKHIHMVVYSSVRLDSEFLNSVGNYNNDIRDIHSVEGLEDYINDGHHKIVKSYRSEGEEQGSNRNNIVQAIGQVEDEALKADMLAIMESMQAEKNSVKRYTEEFLAEIEDDEPKEDKSEPKQSKQYKSKYYEIMKQAKCIKPNESKRKIKKSEEEILIEGYYRYKDSKEQL